MNTSLATQEERKTIRAELNIEKWPIFTTSTFKGKSREISREIITEDRKRLSKKVIVGKIADKEVGVLRIFEMKGFYTLIKIWEKAGKPIDKNVNFALHQVAEILKREWGGTTYRQIKNMIDKLRFIPIKWIYSWKVKDGEEEYTLEDGFTILADKRIFEKKESGQMEFSFSSFRFHNAILKNLIENHTKPVYLDVILKLKKEVSILLYRHLDLIMADKNYFERRTRELFSDLELSEYSRPSARKRLLEPVLKELEGVELSTGILNQAKLKMTKNGEDWKVVFKKSPKRFKIEYKRAPGEEEKEGYLKERGEEERLDKIFLGLSQEEQEKLKEEAKGLIIEQYSDGSGGSQEKVNEFFLRDIMVMIKVRELLREREIKNESRH
ncbi:MAG: replication initiator protein A [Candidatus Omnitrophica bacterium]|nr:replication initiator protein A [Candidatus Omnitrophota bacterium]